MVTRLYEHIFEFTCFIVRLNLCVSAFCSVRCGAVLHMGLARYCLKNFTSISLVPEQIVSRWFSSTSGPIDKNCADYFYVIHTAKVYARVSIL